MNRLVVIFSMVICSQGVAQTTGQSLFNDTSLYFIQQTDNLKSVALSPEELALVEQLLTKAANEFTAKQQRYLDSLRPGKHKSKQAAQRIDLNNYFFLLMPGLNKDNQKEVWISGNCKNRFRTGHKRKAVYDKEWKHKFVDGQLIADGGSCYINILINLTLKTHGSLGVNGEG